MLAALQASPDLLAATLVPLQMDPALLENPLGTLLIALVVVAVVVFVGRYVMSIAWRLIKIAIVVVGLVWLATVVVPIVGPMVGL